MIKKSFKKSAFSLVEILLGLAIFAVFSAGVFYLSIDSLDTNIKHQNENEALLYAQEGLEAARMIRNKNFTYLVNGEYGLSSTGSTWDFITSPETINDFYTRTITVEDAYRDENGNIAESGTVDTNVKKITSRVDWSWKNYLAKTISLVTYLSDWTGNQWMQTTCTNFNTGTLEDIDVSEGSPPPEDNCVLTLSVVEEASEFYAEADVGAHGTDVAINSNYAYVAVSKTNEGFSVVDISDIANPNVIKKMDVNGKGKTIIYDSNHVYMGIESSSKGLAIIDVSNPNNPVIKSTTNIGGSGNRMAKVGNYLYVGVDATSNSFKIYDVSNPSSPVFKGQKNISAKTYTVEVSGAYAYIGTSDSTKGLQIINISDPTSPQVSSTLNVSSQGIKAVKLNGTIVYVGKDTTSNSLGVVNISNPLSPQLSSSLEVGAKIQDLAIQGDYLYGALDSNHPTIAAVNISQPSSPYLAYNLDAGGKGTGITANEDYVIMTMDVSNEGLIIVGTTVEGSATSGTYTSSIFDTGSSTTRYNAIEWALTAGAWTGAVQMQIRTSSSSGGIESATWVGSDGTNSTYYTNSPSTIVTDPNTSGTRYIQVNIFLSSDGVNSPGLDYFTIDYNP